MSVEEQLSALMEEFTKLQAEHKRQAIWLGQYEKDSAELLEKHGVDPDDKVDREVLKRMLNYLIGKNRRLKEIIETAIKLHHKSIAEVVNSHERGLEWLESAKELKDDEKHNIFSIWLLKQALKDKQ